ncbi:MAG: hypothetical protein WCO68_08165, partial [Verrucomicrobiota bacterium]
APPRIKSSAKFNDEICGLIVLIEASTSEGEVLRGEATTALTMHRISAKERRLEERRQFFIHEVYQQGFCYAITGSPE